MFKRTCNSIDSISYVALLAKYKVGRLPSAVCDQTSRQVSMWTSLFLVELHRIIVVSWSTNTVPRTIHPILCRIRHVRRSLQCANIHFDLLTNPR